MHLRLLRVHFLPVSVSIPGVPELRMDGKMAAGTDVVEKGLPLIILARDTEEL